MTSQSPRYQLVVVAYKSRTALESFLGHLGKGTPIVLVDNSASEEDLTSLLANYPNVQHVDAEANLGYSAGSNLGAQRATADYVIFMNPDTRPTVGSLDALVGYLEANPGVASCGPAGIGTAGGGAQPTALRLLAHSLGLHRRFPQAGIYYQDVRGRETDVGWVSGSCLAIRRNLFNQLGGFDPRYFVYHSDFDLGLRVHGAGFRQVVVGSVVVPHDDGGSSDLPQEWTWDRRGRAWTRFLRNTRSTPGALGLSLLLLAGYAVRSVTYSIIGRRMRARELRTYLTSGIKEWFEPARSLETANRDSGQA